MMMNHKTIFMLATALLMSGCAGMSVEECQTSDWRAVGFEDGSRGYTSDRFANHRKACAKHGVAANFELYQQGRAEGLYEYCVPSRGFNVGAAGGRYYGVCSADVEAGFLDAYRIGQQLHTHRANLSNTSSLIYAKEQELKATEARIAELGVSLVGAEATPEERVLMLAELKEKSERTGELEEEIEQLIADRARFEYELQNYEQVVAGYGY